MKSSDASDLLSVPKPPITHPLQTSAGSLTKVWSCIAAVIFAGVLLIKLLHANRVIASGQVTPVVILGVMAMIAAGFSFLLSMRARREFRAMRCGEYLARWPYSEEEGKRLSGEVSDDRTWRVKAIFWILFVAIGGSGTVLSVIGAFAKSDPMVFVRIAPHALWIGVAVGACFALPARYLFGIAQRIAQDLEPVAIFTRTGFYTPGRFIPIMDFGPGQRKATLVTMRDGRSWLRFDLVQGMPGSPHRKLDVCFQLPVPAGRLEEAQALLEHFRGA